MYTFLLHKNRSIAPTPSMNSKLTLQWTGNRNSQAFFKVNPGSSPSGMQRTAALSLQFSFRTTFHFPSFVNTDPSVLGMGWKRETAAAKPQASPTLHNLTCTSKAAVPAALPSTPGAANPRFPRAGLSSGPCNQPNQARIGPTRPGPPVRSNPWTPASGAGRGPRRPPPRQLALGRRECAPPATPAPDLPAGESGAPGQRPRAWGRAPRWLEPVPGTSSIPGGTGPGETGGLPRASAARRGGRGDLALPSAPVHRRRRHFAFHSVSPPPHSAAGFPDVGISRRRLRGGRELGASVRPAASGQRAACGLPPSAGRPLLSVLASVAPRRPRLALPGWLAPARGIRLSPSQVRSFQYLFLNCALSVHE